MNKVYKVVWSKVKNAYVVASELAKSRTKAPKSGVISRAVVAGVLACVSCDAPFLIDEKRKRESEFLSLFLIPDIAYGLSLRLETAL